MSNPITEPGGGGNYKERILLDEGEYVWTLKGIKPKMGKAFNSDEMVPKLSWFFVCKEKPDAASWKQTSTSTWAKKGNESGAVKMLADLDFKGLKALKKLGEGENLYYDKDEFWTLCQAQIGKDFVAFNEPDDKYNQISRLRPYIPGEAVQSPKAPEPVKESEVVKVSFDDDSIPF